MQGLRDQCSLVHIYDESFSSMQKIAVSLSKGVLGNALPSGVMINMHVCQVMNPYSHKECSFLCPRAHILLFDLGFFGSLCPPGNLIPWLVVLPRLVSYYCQAQVDKNSKDSRRTLIMQILFTVYYLERIVRQELTPLANTHWASNKKTIALYSYVITLTTQKLYWSSGRGRSSWWSY